MGKPVVFASEKLLRSSYQIRDCSGVNPFTDVMPARACDQDHRGRLGGRQAVLRWSGGALLPAPPHGAQWPPLERLSQGHPCGWRGL